MTCSQEEEGSPGSALTKEKQERVCSVAIRHQKIHTGAPATRSFLESAAPEDASFEGKSLELCMIVTVQSHHSQILSQVSCSSSPGEQHDESRVSGQQWASRFLFRELYPVSPICKSLSGCWCVPCLLHFKRQICSDGSMSSEFVMLTVCLVHVDFIGSVLRTSKSWMKILTSVGLITNPYNFFFLLEKAPITDGSPFLWLLFDIFQYSQFSSCSRCFLLIVYISSSISRSWISLGLLL